MKSSKLIVFDCDSTLSSIEGVDELAALRDTDIKRQIEDLTNQAMNGEVPIAEVFGKRLELIQPSQEMVDKIGQMYIDTIVPGVVETITTLKEAGWNIAIVSGGFTPVILPLAKHLGITEVQAVPLFFKPDGSYDGFDTSAPTTRNGGKPEVVKKLTTHYQADITIMVGDGISDLETKDTVHSFIGFGGVVARPQVKDSSEYYTEKFSEIINFLPKPA